MDLNGEVPRGPLDAFFMSRPRYTPRHKWQAPQTLFSSLLSRTHARDVVALDVSARRITLVTSSPFRITAC